MVEGFAGERTGIRDWKTKTKANQPLAVGSRCDDGKGGECEWLPLANRSWDAFVWGRLVMGIELISDRDVADESSSAKGYD